MKVGYGPGLASDPESARQLHIEQHAQRLAGALHAGDLSSAKFAFVKLRQSVTMDPAPSQSRPMQQPLSELADALVTGNLETASKALQNLRKAMLDGRAGKEPAAGLQPGAPVIEPAPVKAALGAGLGSVIDIVL